MVDINLDMLMASAKEVDGTGTQITSEARKALAERLKPERTSRTDGKH